MRKFFFFLVGALLKYLYSCENFCIKNCFLKKVEFQRALSISYKNFNWSDDFKNIFLILFVLCISILSSKILFTGNWI